MSLSAFLPLVRLAHFRTSFSIQTKVKPFITSPHPEDQSYFESPGNLSCVFIMVFITHCYNCVSLLTRSSFLRFCCLSSPFLPPSIFPVQCHPYPWLQLSLSPIKLMAFKCAALAHISLLISRSGIPVARSAPLLDRLKLPWISVSETSCVPNPSPQPVPSFLYF